MGKSKTYLGKNQLAETEQKQDGARRNLNACHCPDGGLGAKTQGQVHRFCPGSLLPSQIREGPDGFFVIRNVLGILIHSEVDGPTTGTRAPVLPSSSYM